MRTVVYKNYDRDDEKTEWMDQKRDELNYWRYGQEEQNYLDTEIEDAWKEKLEEEFYEKIEEIESSLSSGETLVGILHDDSLARGSIHDILRRFDTNYQDYVTTIYYDNEGTDRTYIVKIGVGSNSPEIALFILTKEGDDYLSSVSDTAEWEVLWNPENGCIKEIPYVGGR